MNLFSRIASLIIHGNGSGEKILDAGIAGIDKLFYTAEEKAEHQAALFKDWQALQIELAKKNTGTAINRRLISWFVVAIILFNFQLAVFLGISGNIEGVNIIIKLCEQFWIGQAFIAVIGFYYGPHLFNQR